MIANYEGKSTSVPGPDNVLRRVLDNGIVCQAYENFSSPSVVVSLRIKAPALAVGRDKAGLAGFVADMMTRGSETRDFQAFNETIESVGASMGFEADWVASGAGGRCLAEDLPLFLDVLGDCLLRPTFPLDQIVKVRGEILTSLEQRAHDTRRMAMLRFYETLYKGHPLGISGLGYTDSAMSITQEDLWRYYHDHYRPEGAILTIVGAVKAEGAIAQVEKHLGGWRPAGEPSELVVPPAPRPERVLSTEVGIPGKTQADVVLGTVGLTRLSPDYMAARLANTILGVFGMMGRVGESVRERQGMAYYAYTNMVSGQMPGSWMAVAGVAPENVDRAVAGILAEFRGLQDEPVPAQELEDNKSYLTGSMPLGLETNSGIASMLQTIEVFGLGLDYLARYPAMVAEITAEDVQRVAQKYLSTDAYVLSVAKPA